MDKILKTVANVSEFTIPDDTAVIWSDASFYNEKIKKVYFPSSLKLIKDGAFCGCKNIAEIDLSKTNVVTIEESGFSDCTKLSKVLFPPSLEELRDLAFSDCSNLIEVDLSNTNVKRIGIMAFQNCTKLKRVLLPDRKIEIAHAAFEGCKALEEINLFELPDDIIGKFKGCKKLAFVKSEKPKIKTPDNAIYDLLSDKIIIRPGITEIRRRDFPYLDLKTFRKISIPESVEKIEFEAFEHLQAPIDVYVSDLEHWKKISSRDGSKRQAVQYRNLYIKNKLYGSQSFVVFGDENWGRSYEPHQYEEKKIDGYTVRLELQGKMCFYRAFDYLINVDTIYSHLQEALKKETVIPVYGRDFPQDDYAAEMEDQDYFNECLDKCYSDDTLRKIIAAAKKDADGNLIVNRKNYLARQNYTWYAKLSTIYMVLEAKNTGKKEITIECVYKHIASQRTEDDMKLKKMIGKSDLLEGIF